MTVFSFYRYVAEIRIRRPRDRSAVGVGKPGRQEALRRSVVQLQQTRQAGGEHQRRSPGVHKAETVAAHRRGT